MKKKKITIIHYIINLLYDYLNKLLLGIKKRRRPIYIIILAFILIILSMFLIRMIHKISYSLIFICILLYILFGLLIYLIPKMKYLIF